MDRNKQQTDIMFNMVFDFGIHGIPVGQQFFKQLVELVQSYGDAIRIVGFNTKKPTARVNTNTLYESLFVPYEVVESLPETEETTEVEDDDAIESSDTGEKEDVSDDKESDRND